MAGIDNRILNFDRGVEGVLFTETSNAARLPQTTPLTPWDGQVEARLEQMFQSPTRDEGLRDLLKPQSLPSSALNPGNFRDMLRNSGKKLAAAARERPELQDAVDVLQDLQASEELLAAYRNSLRQA